MNFQPKTLKTGIQKIRAPLICTCLNVYAISEEEDEQITFVLLDILSFFTAVCFQGITFSSRIVESLQSEGPLIKRDS